MNTRVCKTCGEEKPLTTELWYKHRSSSRGFYIHCKECMKRKQREAWARNATPEKRRKWMLKGVYNITPEEYDAIARAQDYVCAICKQECPSGQHLSIDHCHDSGEVRGLLCKTCNRAIGQLKDNPERVLAAYQYLANFYYEKAK